jgi:hypothetical protein
MPVFRIICLSAGVLEEWEEFEAAGLVEALGARNIGHACERVEVWREGKRVAVLGGTRTKPLTSRRAGQRRT